MNQGSNKQNKNKIVYMPTDYTPCEARKRRLAKLNKATNVINLSFERILAIKIKDLNV